jgi:SAM-dependent methyltransferase
MSRLRSYVPVFVKRIVWNWKHRNNFTDPARCQKELLESLDSLEPDSGILDLGCGAGNLRAALRTRGWNGHYVGIDVSEKAIEIAKKSGDGNAAWHVVAIEHFSILENKVSTICLCESLYYVTPRSVPALIEKCRQSLASSDGRIVIRIWNAERHP